MTTRRHLMIRGVALIMLLMAGYILWTRNFGEGIRAVPVVAVISAAISFALDWIDRSQSERLKKYLTHSMLSIPFLVTGYLVMLLLLTLNAPVTVLSSSDQALPVTVDALDVNNFQLESAMASTKEPARFHIWSTPLGRPFRLKVKGYTAKVLNVVAPMGATISIEHDMLPEVVVLIRPTLDGMMELSSGGSVHVFEKKPNQRNEIACARSTRLCSVLVGAAIVPIPPDMFEDWRLELAGERMQDTAVSTTLRAWKTPVEAVTDASADELAPHQVLQVELQNKDDQPIQCGTMELPESSAIVDFPLGKCPAPGAAGTAVKVK